MKKKTHRSILEKCKSVLTDKEYGVMAKALTDYEKAEQIKENAGNIKSHIMQVLIQAVNETNQEKDS